MKYDILSTAVWANFVTPIFTPNNRRKIMAKQKTVVPFKGTPEQEMQLRKIIAEHKDMEGALMPVL